LNAIENDCTYSFFLANVDKPWGNFIFAGQSLLVIYALFDSLKELQKP